MNTTTRRSFFPRPPSRGKMLLLYSGGLDTSCILKWCIKQGYNVYAFIANLGQDQDFDYAKSQALKIGATDVFIEDLRHTFVKDYIFPSIQGNARYENKYLLGTSLARYPIAERAVTLAQENNIETIGHGSTSKGNDQVRFELSLRSLDPTINICSPWKDPKFSTKFKGRNDLLSYARSHCIIIPTNNSTYSMDENIFHTSYESGILEDPACSPSEDMFKINSLEKSPEKSEHIIIYFERGVPVKVYNSCKDINIEGCPVKILSYLNKLGSKHGVGRIDMVENRFTGMKSRGVYETPGGTILREAHIDLESICMDREVKNIRDMITVPFSRKIYNGFWFSPEMELMLNSIIFSQKNINGQVNLKIYKGNVIVMGRSSPTSLYNNKVVSMDTESETSMVQGFIDVHSLRLKMSNNFERKK